MEATFQRTAGVVWVTLAAVLLVAGPAASQTIFAFDDVILEADARAGDASVQGLASDPEGTVEEVDEDEAEALVSGDWEAGGAAGVYVITFDGRNGASAGVGCSGGNVTEAQPPGCSPFTDVDIARCYNVLGSFICIL